MSQDRKKASDIFRETNYVFSKKVPFQEAFPQIEDISVKVTERGTGVYGKSKTWHFKKNVGEYVDCSNPICYNGGVSIGSILREMVRSKETEKQVTKVCQGNEGSPKGRRIYRKCLNMFDIEVKISYKE